MNMPNSREWEAMAKHPTVVENHSGVLELIGKSCNAVNPEDFVVTMVEAYGMPITNFASTGTYIDDKGQWCSTEDAPLEPDIVMLNDYYNLIVSMYPNGFVAIQNSLKKETLLLTRFS